jgi:hypothetical protein
MLSYNANLLYLNCVITCEMTVNNKICVMVNVIVYHPSNSIIMTHCNLNIMMPIKTVLKRYNVY